MKGAVPQVCHSWLFLPATSLGPAVETWAGCKVLPWFTSESPSCRASSAPSDFNWHSGCWKLWKWSWYRYPVSQCALEEPFGFACVSPFHPDVPLNFCTNPTINRMLHLLPFKSLSKSIYISLSPRCICAVSEKKIMNILICDAKLLFDKNLLMLSFKHRCIKAFLLF